MKKESIMSFTRFGIWDKELADFFCELDKQHIDKESISAMKDWFYNFGPLLIYKGEEISLLTYIKTFVKEVRRWPDLSSVGLAGYMLQTLQEVRRGFFETFSQDDLTTKRLLEAEFDSLLVSAFKNHDEFYKWRAEVTTSKMALFVASVKVPTSDAQSQFIEVQIIEALDSEKYSEACKTDLRNFLEYTRQVNIKLTPQTRSRNVFKDREASKSHSSHDKDKEQRLSPGQSPRIDGRQLLHGRIGSMDKITGGTPLSILRGLKTSPTNATAIDDHKPPQDGDDSSPSSHRMGFKA
jgi:hypothetical protein